MKPHLPRLLHTLETQDFLVSIVLSVGMAWLSCLPNASWQGCLEGGLEGKERECISTLDARSGPEEALAAEATWMEALWTLVSRIPASMDFSH